LVFLKLYAVWTGSDDATDGRYSWSERVCQWELAIEYALGVRKDRRREDLDENLATGRTRRSDSFQLKWSPSSVLDVGSVSRHCRERSSKDVRSIGKVLVMTPLRRSLSALIASVFCPSFVF